MINRFQLIRNVGLFDSYSGSEDEELGRLTLIYAENGQGKTTLSAILRSLQTGDPIPILERARLGADHPPHVVLNHTGGATSVFEQGRWSVSHPNIWVFDDAFVHENVHAGLEVGPSHRQNLHEVIIGREGVRLARAVETQTELIAAHQRTVRDLEREFDRSIMGGLEVEAFCGLREPPNLDQSILNSARELQALRKAGEVQQQPLFSAFAAPSIPTDEITTCLARTLQGIGEAALSAVSQHFSSLGEEGETWVSKGMEFAGRLEEGCPFCAQDLGPSDLFRHYLAYFDEAYEEHLLEIDRLRSTVANDLSGDALAGFQRRLARNEALHRFWSEFTELPEIDLEMNGLVEAWQTTRESFVALLDEKRADPLRTITIGEEEQEHLDSFLEESRIQGELSRLLVEANQQINAVKDATAEGDIHAAEATLSLLNAAKARNEEPHEARCQARQEAIEAKQAADAEKERLRGELDGHRAAVFPGYQASINEILTRFNASFRIVRLEPTNPRGVPSSQYFLEVNQEEVPVVSDAEPGTPTFRSTLSGGDRTTLAFAFFLAALRREQSLEDDIVVIDDPLSSLDDHRSTVTSQEIQALVPRTAQTIVLSHSKRLLCSVWSRTRQGDGVPLEIRVQGGSTALVSWNIHEDAVTEYDRRHDRLRRFVREGGSREEARRVASDLRPILEGYLRVVCTEIFHPGDVLSHFMNRARQVLADGGDPVYTQDQLDQLQGLIDSANRFHHETNPAWDRVLDELNEQELRGFGTRVIQFTTPAGN